MASAIAYKRSANVRSMGNVEKRAWLDTAMKGSFSRFERRKVVERRDIMREGEVGWERVKRCAIS